MKHGGDVLTYQDQFNGEIIDFSSNINPLGFPKGLRKQLELAINKIDVYPDIQYRKLKQSISEYLKCETENIVLGNGSMEIIDSAIHFKEKVFIFYPTFGEYEERAHIHNKKFVMISLDENFETNLETLKNNLEEDSVLIIGNPNNPTGLRIKKEKLLLIYNIVMSKNSILVLDEAFYEFSPSDYDSVELFKAYNYENVIIIRAATKVFALPGLRLGYGCTNPIMAKEMKKRQLPWSVNTLAVAAGNFIFEQKDYIKETRKYVEGERDYLMTELTEIEGINPYPSHSNFILIKLEKFTGEHVFKELLTRGILIRTCTSFVGLDDSYIRIAVKSRRDNEVLIKSLKAIFEEE